MEDLSKNRLMRLQVEQLEKENKDFNQRLHIERAYRKDERPRLAQDYADQQAADRMMFEDVQKSRIENSLAVHNQAVASKKRLGRMQDEYKVHRTMLLAARSEEYQRLKASAEKKLEEEREKRRRAYVEQKEAEIRERGEVEAAAREAEEERLRVEAGAYPACPSLYASSSRANGRTSGGRRGRGSAETRKRRTARRTASTARPRAGRRSRGSPQKGTARGRGGRTRAVAFPAGQDGPGHRGRLAGACTSADKRASARAEFGACPVTRVCDRSTQDWDCTRRLASTRKEKQAGAPAGAATATSPATTNAPLPDTKKDTDGFEMVSGKGPHGSGRLRERTGWAEVCTRHVRVFNFRLVVCFVCFFPIRYHTFVSSGGGRPATKA